MATYNRWIAASAPGSCDASNPRDDLTKPLEELNAGVEGLSLLKDLFVNPLEDPWEVRIERPEVPCAT